MGNTYSFEKVKRENFMNGKSRFVMDDDDCFIDGYNTDYHAIVTDLDREDFLYRLVRPKDGELDSDVELSNYLKNIYSKMDEQAIVVTAKSISNALEIFRALDRKVESMPYDDNGEAFVCLKSVYEEADKKERLKYVEDKPKDPKYPNYPGYLYCGSSKNNVEVYKEVEKVYGDRAYHYHFPWKHPKYRKGAYNIISALEEVLKEMSDPDNADYVFLFTWT